MRRTFTRDLVLLAGLAALLVPATAWSREVGAKRDPATIRGIVLHSIGGPACVKGKVHYQTIQKRPDDAEFWRGILARGKSADVHYVVGRSGTVSSLIAEDEIAFHVVGNNDDTIGIEMVNSGSGEEAFPQAQVDAVIDLVRKIRERNPTIALRNVVTHAVLDQRTCECAGKTYPRRPDPGAAFPFSKLIGAVTLPGETAETGPDLKVLSGPAKARLCVTR
ncbi:peptidoglycan recognition family protein [Oricola sp.]|uniref:N-acetylmuramoyl-L-alanine amidase n=1 Tax=Oricola sp. TaxID=1979950 RepID=UPI0025F133F3|nr:peptidoglycan recognition family protein [Oricola sp.]MCI5077478.1 peptidoglycan recognition protein family protein [Oricola sp.]